MSKKTLRIGLDFDNTLICYDQVFYQLALELRFIDASVPAQKASIRQSIVKRFGNDLYWQKLQSLAYGPQISKARLFDGVLCFVQAMAAEGHEIFIVSHKSTRSHYNPNIKLREHALTFMKESGLVGSNTINNENVYFAQTLEDKLTKITDLKLDVFVDDLSKVLLDKTFPIETMAIKFKGNKIERCLYADSWQQINRYVEHINHLQVKTALKKAELSAYLSCFGRLPEQINALKRDGNNLIYQVSDGDKKIVLKRYYQSETDTRNRAKVEFDCLHLLSSHDFEQVPKAIYKHCDDGFAFYQYLDGKVPNVDSADNQFALATGISSFVMQLKRLHDGYNMSEQPLAADARLRFADYFSKIDQRLSAIMSGCRHDPRLKQVKQFVSHRLLPFRAKLFRHARNKMAIMKLNESTEFSIVNQTLNPSDLGPHNMIENSNGELAFIDFEYFGLDDPAKMLADLFHHAQEKLSLQSCWLIYQKYVQVYPEIENRFSIVNDLIAFEWLLIILNIANPDALQRRLFANPTLDVEKLIKQRLLHAQKRFNHYLNVVELGGEFLTLADKPELISA